jgi:hypothetical protein
VKLTATVLNSAQQPVRTLATNAALGKGAHSLTWDGPDSGGLPVADGDYTLTVSYTDSAGNTQNASTQVVVDGTPPAITVVSARTLKQTRGFVARLSDKTTGLGKATLSIDGRKVRTLAGGETQLTYIPRGGWRPRTHLYRISASDEPGNLAGKTGSFKVTAPRR